MIIHNAILGKSIPFLGLLDFSNILLKMERFCNLSQLLEVEIFCLVAFSFLFMFCFVSKDFNRQDFGHYKKNSVVEN